MSSSTEADVHAGHEPLPLVIEEEVTLANTLAILWLARWWILLPTLLAMLIAYVYSSTRPPIYDAVATAEVRHPPGHARSPAAVESWRASLGSSVIAERVLRLLPPDQGPPTVQEFLVENLVVEGVHNTDLLLVRGRHREPARAALIANRVLEQTIAYAAEQYNARYPPADGADDRLARAETGLRQATEMVERLRREQPIEWRNDRQASLSAQIEMRRLEIDLETNRGRIARLEDDMVHLGHDEASQAVATRLRDEIGAARTDMAIVERRHQLLAESHPAASDTLPLTDAERELALRTDVYNVAKATYLEALAWQHRARPEVTILDVVDRALPPAAPLSPRPGRDAALGGVAMLIVTALGVLLIDGVRLSLARRRMTAPVTRVPVTGVPSR